MPRAKKRIDASQIARIAHVSQATVSRVINNYEYVSPQTRERVLKAIRDYNYTPNFSAQMLAGKCSNTIGLFIVFEERSTKSSLENTHTNFMMERVLLTAAEQGYFVLTDVVKNIYDPDEKKRIADMFAQSRIDGGIFIGFPNDYPLIEEQVARGYVVGLFDQFLPGRNECNRIVVGFQSEVFGWAVEYAASLGHRDILFVNGNLHKYSGVEKQEIFIRTMQRLGLPVGKENVLTAGHFTRRAAQETMSAFLASGAPVPTCIYCGNDIIAFGVIDVLRAHNLEVPRDVSVIGVDDIFVSDLFTPALTTIRYDFDQMLDTLTLKVSECIKNPFSEHFRGNFPGTPVIRDSCAPPRAEKLL